MQKTAWRPNKTCLLFYQDQKLFQPVVLMKILKVQQRISIILPKHFFPTGTFIQGGTFNMYCCSQHKENDVKKKQCLRNEKGNLWLNPIQTVTDISTYIYIWYCNTSSLRINFSIKICVSFVLYVANVTVHLDLTCIQYTCTLYVYVGIF